MSKRAESAERKYYGALYSVQMKNERNGFIKGYEQAEKDIISLIESRIGEIMGDAQPAPILRYELQDLIKKIKEEE